MRLTLLVDGRAAVVRVMNTAGHPLLNKAAAYAAMQYRYRPFETHAVATPVRVEAVISFALVPDPPPPSIPFPAITDLNSLIVEYTDGAIILRVLGNGHVEYNGISGVVVEGKHRTQISREDVQSLVEVFRRADFFSLRDDYAVGATDVGVTTTSIQNRKSAKEHQR